MIATATHSEEACQLDEKAPLKPIQNDFLPSQIYTRKEVAEKLDVSEITLIRAERRGELRSYRAGRKIRYTGRMVKAWLERDRSEK